MIRYKILRNICLVMFVLQSLCTVRYLTDIALGGDTEWWQPLSAGVIAVVLYILFDKYRRRAKTDDM